MLVRVAGESLTSSVEESASERCEQCALGLQKLAPNRQLDRESEAVKTEPGESRPVIQKVRGTRVFLC